MSSSFSLPFVLSRLEFLMPTQSLGVLAEHFHDPLGKPAEPAHNSTQISQESVTFNPLKK